MHCSADHCLHIPILEGHLVLPKNHNTALLATAQTGTSGRKKGLVLAGLEEEALNVVRSLAASSLGTLSLRKNKLLQKVGYVAVYCFSADSASSPGASRKPPSRCCVLVFHKCAEGLTGTRAARWLHGSSCPPGFPDLRGLGEKFCSYPNVRLSNVREMVKTNHMPNGVNGLQGGQGCYSRAVLMVLLHAAASLW